MIMKQTGGGCQQLVITICNYARFQRVSLPKDKGGTVAGQHGCSASDCSNSNNRSDDPQGNRRPGQQRDKQESIKNTKSPHNPPNGETASPDEDEEMIDLEFEKFWRAFPPGRKQDKLKARRKYRAIVSGRDPDLKATTSQLLAGTKLYASKMAGREARFTKMPCTWLTNGCWLEDNAGAPPVFGLQEKAKAKSPDDIWFENTTRRILGEQKAQALLAGDSR